MNMYEASMKPLRCPFCALEIEQVAASRAAVAVLDGFPVAEGHTLIIPRRHVGSVFELGPDELGDFFALVAQVRAQLADELAPHGFTIGVNDGEAAGQTVGHAHLHIIPRRHGDVPDPRGGVRWVLPEHADYWSAP